MAAPPPDPSPPILPLFDDAPMPAGANDGTRRLTPASAPRAAALAPPPAPAGSGQLVRLAWPVLAVLMRLAAGAAIADAGRLKTETVALLRQFERQAQADAVEARLIAATTYTLCTAIDEAAVLADPATANLWTHGSLLSLLHNETWGGEKVFILAERALAEPQRYADLLELCHWVLVLGFQGRFRRERDGTAKVDALREQIFDALRPRFGDKPRLAAITADAPARQAGGRLIHYVPIWSVAVVCLLLSAVIYAALDYRLRSDAGGVASGYYALAAAPASAVARPVP